MAGRSPHLPPFIGAGEGEGGLAEGQGVEMAGGSPRPLPSPRPHPSAACNSPGPTPRPTCDSVAELAAGAQPADVQIQMAEEGCPSTVAASPADAIAPVAAAAVAETKRGRWLGGKRR
jgi:hypothetical protein